MAIQPIQPQRRDRLGKALAIGGALAGAPGGVQGAMLGASAGSTAAGLLERPQAQPVESQGMARRRDAISVDPLRAISEAQAALQTLPPDQFPEVRRAFEQATALARRNQELGLGRV